MAILAISDDLSEAEWNPQFHAEELKRSLQEIIELVIPVPQLS